MGAPRSSALLARVALVSGILAGLPACVHDDLYSLAWRGETERLARKLSHSPGSICLPSWHGESGLHYAAASGKVETLDLFLEAGCPLDDRNGEGLTPLMVAAEQGKAETTWALLDAVANPELATPKGLTALHFAASRADESLVGMLLEHGVAVDPVATGCFTPKPCHARHWTPLSIAARFSGVKTVDLLLERGAEVSFAREGSFSPLWLALSRPHPVPQIVERLLAAGADRSAVWQGIGATDFVRRQQIDADPADADAYARIIELLDSEATAPITAEPAGALNPPDSEPQAPAASTAETDEP